MWKWKRLNRIWLLPDFLITRTISKGVIYFEIIDITVKRCVAQTWFMCPSIIWSWTYNVDKYIIILLCCKSVNYTNNKIIFHGSFVTSNSSNITLKKKSNNNNINNSILLEAINLRITSANRYEHVERTWL